MAGLALAGLSDCRDCVSAEFICSVFVTDLLMIGHVELDVESDMGDMDDVVDSE